MAKGIDAEAHRGALAVDGHTAAVPGSRLNHPYPSQNPQLFDEICEQGVGVSEFSLATPKPHNFPRRNRVLSGLSLGALVVEAGDRSGALITVRHSLEQNREVFAISGLDPFRKKFWNASTKQAGRGSDGTDRGHPL